MTSTVTMPPSATTVGISSDQSIEKWAGTIFDSGGRLSQIWKSSRSLVPSPFTSGNISECWIPDPVVSHWVSPSP